MMATTSFPPLAEGSVIRGIVFALGGYAAFATGDALIKLMTVGYSVFQIGATVSVVGLLPVLLLCHDNGGLRALIPVRTKLVVLRALLGAFGAICAWSAFSRIGLADVYTLLFAVPVIVTVLSPYVLGEEVGWRRLTAALVGFAGVLVIIGPHFEELALGHAMAALAALFAAAAFMVLKKIGPHEKSAAIIAVNLVLMIAICTVIGAADFVWMSWSDLGTMTLIGLLMGFGQASMVFATRQAPVVVVAPFQYTSMFWGIVYGYLFFGDMPTISMGLGMVLIVGSGLYILWREMIRSRQGTLAARGEVTARAARI